ncbi:MAG TPA: hypothetical protein VLT88_03945 [Desulfosarcina sp.]|nr:hypothetical protein [Desulfosarcina sp.]
MRILLLVLMTALSANTLLAAVGTGTGCDVGCTCCPDAAGGSTPSLSGGSSAGCCGPAQTGACHVFTDRLPAAPPAAMHAIHQPPNAPGHLPAASTADAAKAPWTAPARSRAEVNPKHATLPIYLSISRIIR